jgi:putative transposase
VRNLKRLHRETGSISPRPRTFGTYRRFPIDKLPELEGLLKQGAIAHGWINELWTIQRVWELIGKKFNIHLSQGTVWKILTRDLHWSSIKPQTVLRERDEEKIAQWRVQGFDEIRLRAEKRGAYLVFVDEAGFMLQPTVRKTFAPRGSRPVNKVSDPHGRISTACAITVSPKRKRLYLYFRLLPDNRNFTGYTVASFLTYLHQKLRSPLTIIWDSIPIHSARPVRRHLRSHRETVLEMIPEYAPELNPADGVWSYIKYGRLANFAPPDLATLRKQVVVELRGLCKKPRHLASFIAKSKLEIGIPSSQTA